MNEQCMAAAERGWGWTKAADVRMNHCCAVVLCRTFENRFPCKANIQDTQIEAWDLGWEQSLSSAAEIHKRLECDDGGTRTRKRKRGVALSAAYSSSPSRVSEVMRKGCYCSMMNFQVHGYVLPTTAEG